jgi:class 3 adenylate cyclase
MDEFKDSAIRVTKILLRAQDDSAILQELEQFRRYLAVMFTDIQGSTTYFEKHGDSAGLFMVRRCNDIIRGFVQQYGGTLIKTIGDGSMATFPETEGAVKAAVEMQKELARVARPTSDSTQIAVRIGIHAGTAIVSTNDVFGDVVNVAARVESAAGPGQIVISDEACAQLRDCGVSIRKLGAFKLKGKSEERVLFEVSWDQDTLSSTQFGQPAISDSNALDLKLQILSKGGDVLEQFPIQPELQIRVSSRGALSVSKDTRSEGINARLSVVKGQLWIQGGDGPWPPTFIRLSSAHVLEDGDVFLAGTQVFRFEVEQQSTYSPTRTTTQTISDLLLSQNIVGLCRIDANGNTIARYSLTGDQIQFGRTRGEHLFPQDNLMSRAHLKISRRGDELLVEDLGSRNGTFLKVQGKRTVSPGSDLIIAGQLLRVAG